METDTTEMIGVECPLPLRGVGLTLLGSKMTNVSLVQGEEFQPEPLDSLQREELRRRNMDALHTPIAGETPEARALEEARLANLAERARLENLQRALDERATSTRRQSTSTLPADSGISNPDSEFSSCNPYSRVHPALSVGSWQRLDADQRFAPGSRRSEFSRVAVAQQNSQSIRRCEYGSVGSQSQIASAA